MVTLQKIAERSGVSYQTVSRILNGGTKNIRRDAAARARKVMRIAEAMGYRPNAAARSMRLKQTYQIGVLLRNAPDRPLHYMTEFEFILGVNQFFESTNYVVSVVRIDDVPVDGVGDGRVSRVFRERMLDGVIVLAGVQRPAIQSVQEMIPRCVTLDTEEWEPKCHIRRDEFHCGYTVAKAMAELGYRRVVWSPTAITAATTRRHYSCGERRRGIEKAVADFGLDFEILPVPRWQTTDTITSQQLEGHIAPDSVIITNRPHEAVRIIGLASRFGLCLGRDYSIASCDDSHEIEQAEPGLSRMKYNRLAFGERAAGALLDMIEGDSMEFDSMEIQSEWFPGNTARGPIRSLP